MNNLFDGIKQLNNNNIFNEFMVGISEQILLKRIEKEKK